MKHKLLYSCLTFGVISVIGCISDSFGTDIRAYNHPFGLGEVKVYSSMEFTRCQIQKVLESSLLLVEQPQQCCIMGILTSQFRERYYLDGLTRTENAKCRAILKERLAQHPAEVQQEQ